LFVTKKSLILLYSLINEKIATDIEIMKWSTGKYENSHVHCIRTEQKASTFLLRIRQKDVIKKFQ